MSPAGSHVRITTHALWRLRVAREAPRYLICGMSVAGLIASARFAIAPPRPLIRSLDRTQPAIADQHVPQAGE